MKIEIGKRYVTRSGLVTGKVEANTPLLAEMFPYVCTVGDNEVQSCFTKEGRYWSNGSVSDYDLVSEYKPKKRIPTRIWSILFIVLCMCIGAVLNSAIYEYERMQARNAEQDRLVAEWEKVNAAHDSVNSLLSEARIVYDQLKEDKIRE